MASHYSLVTDATEEPVTLEQVKRQCRIEHTDLDQHLTDWITTARRYVEQITNRTMLEQTRRVKLDRFPADGCEIKLLYPPIKSVTSITYIDTAGATQTWSSSEYIASLTSVPGRITPAYGYTWPLTQDRIDAVTVNYTTGYASIAAVPMELKQAMLLLVDHYYHNGPASDLGKYVDAAVNNLCGRYCLPEYADGS